MYFEDEINCDIYQSFRLQRRNVQDLFLKTGLHNGKLVKQRSFSQTTNLNFGRPNSTKPLQHCNRPILLLGKLVTQRAFLTHHKIFAFFFSFFEETATFSPPIFIRICLEMDSIFHPLLAILRNSPHTMRGDEDFGLG